MCADQPTPDVPAAVRAFARELDTSIQHAIRAHSAFPKRPYNAIRFHDRLTPYAAHPIWCAMTLLAETHLPDSIRHTGYQALLWHDVLEDTTLSLPDDTDPAVRALVVEMTFDSFAEEKRKVWERSDLTKLLKLYDKVSNLLDSTWMSDEKWDTSVEHTLRLAAFVEEVYGELNIVRMARALCEPRPIRDADGRPQRTFDTLTGLADRRSALAWADTGLDQALTDGHQVWIAYFTIDALAHINHELGHSVGDTVLFGLGQLLQRSQHELAMRAFRFGGNAFLGVFIDRTDDEAAASCQAVSEGFAAQHFPARHPDRRDNVLTLSTALADITVAGRRALNERFEALYHALYRRKREQGSRFGVFARVEDGS